MASSISKLIFPNEVSDRHIKALDGLRGFAVLLVLLSHASSANLHLLPVFNLHGAGKGGVMLFFVLSAYLLDRQIAQAYLQKRTGTFYWANYLLRRFLRIFPLYAIALFIYLGLSHMGFSASLDSMADVGEHLLLQKGKGVFWSIPVEFKYYLISPLLLWICHRLFHWNPPYIFGFTLALIIASLTINYFFDLPKLSTVRYLHIFLLGTGAALLQLLHPKLLSRFYNPLLTPIITTLSLACGYALVPSVRNLLWPSVGQIDLPIAFLIWGIIGTRLVLAVQYSNDWFTRIFSWGPLRYLGVISFSAYLFHLPILGATTQLGWLPHSLKLWLFLGVTILCSTASYLLIERPLSKARILDHKA